MTLLVFWIPVILLWVLMRRHWDPLTKKAFWISMLIMTPATAVMEYVYLWADIWDFSEELDPLLGIRIFGAPIEEFFFWFGCAPFMLLLYLNFNRWLKPKGGGHA